MATLQQAGSEMDIGKLQHGTVGQEQIATQASAALAAAPAQFRQSCTGKRLSVMVRTISSRMLGREGNTEL